MLQDHASGFRWVVFSAQVEATFGTEAERCNDWIDAKFWLLVGAPADRVRTFAIQIELCRSLPAGSSVAPGVA